jgi:putative transcriptional regulator
MKNKRLKIARIEADMSQEALAKCVGVTRQTIGAIENGSYNPTLKLCIQICKATGKTLNDLFWEEENNEKG